LEKLIINLSQAWKELESNFVLQMAAVTFASECIQATFWQLLRKCMKNLN
jgi:hypothetical protein